MARGAVCGLFLEEWFTVSAQREKAEREGCEAAERAKAERSGLRGVPSNRLRYSRNVKCDLR